MSVDDEAVRRTDDRLRAGRIAVAGGTGTVGRHVAAIAAARGHEVVVLSRRTGVDLVSGSGLQDALSGVTAVIDVSSLPTQRAEESRLFFGTVTRQLLAAEHHAGVGHHVALSVVGAATVPTGHYAGKVLQERLVASSPVPWTLLRATQFHEFAAQVLDAVRLGPVSVVPTMVCRPVAAVEVAQRLVELAERTPARHARDLGGPRTESLPAMVRAYARRTRRRGVVLAVPLPGPLGRAMRNGTLLTGPDADQGAQTFHQWLRSLDVP